MFDFVILFCNRLIWLHCLGIAFVIKLCFGGVCGGLWGNNDVEMVNFLGSDCLGIGFVIS